MQYIIETEKLYKEFYPTRSPNFRDFFCFSKEKNNIIVACDEIDLKIKKGELFGLVGPNGAGKTTLLKIFATLILPDAGKAEINGFDILSQDDEVRNSIGLVTSETKSFYVRLTGRENLYFFANLYNLFSKPMRKKVEELATLLDIKDALDIMYQEYSTGVKQRFAIARGLLNDAPILLVDEPTKSLDPSSAKALRDFIRKKLVEQKKKTVVFTSHSLSEIQNLADTIAIMDEGRIKASGSFEDLKQGMSNLNSGIEEVFDYYTKERS